DDRRPLGTQSSPAARHDPDTDERAEHGEPGCAGHAARNATDGNGRPALRPGRCGRSVAREHHHAATDRNDSGEHHVATDRNDSGLFEGPVKRGRGFTLVELVLALSIVALMLVILFSGLRVTIRAWQRGEERANALEHARSMAQLVQQTLAGAYPFQGPMDESSAAQVVFKGEA